MPNVVSIHTIFAANGNNFPCVSAFSPHNRLAFQITFFINDTAQGSSSSLELITQCVGRQFVTPHVFTTVRLQFKLSEVMGLRLRRLLADDSYRSRHTFCFQPICGGFIRHVLCVLLGHFCFLGVPHIHHLLCPAAFCIRRVEVVVCSSEITNHIKHFFVQARFGVFR